jgi:hypothetical protein
MRRRPGKEVVLDVHCALSARSHASATMRAHHAACVADSAGAARAVACGARFGSGASARPRRSIAQAAYHSGAALTHFSSAGHAAGAGCGSFAIRITHACNSASRLLALPTLPAIWPAAAAAALESRKGRPRCQAVRRISRSQPRVRWSALRPRRLRSNSARNSLGVGAAAAGSGSNREALRAARRATGAVGCRSLS